VLELGDCLGQDLGANHDVGISDDQYLARGALHR